MTMASTSSTANSVQTSGDLQGKEAEPIKRSAAASVSTSVPPSAGPRETLLYASVFAAAFGYAAGDFYLNIGRSPKKELHPMTLTNGWLSKWMERSFSLESDLKDGYKFLIFASVGFLLVSQVTIRLAPRWVHYLATTSFTLAVTAAILGYRTAMYFLVLHCGAVCMGYFSQFGVWLFILSAMMLQNSDYSSALFQNFMLVYVQLYGWPGLVSSIDGVELPHWPDCISRVYTYRQMWRVFDRGLASFMYSHIYIPMGGSRHGIVRQVAAVAASFAFVSIYHGDSTSVRIWAALNALQLLLETLACAFYERKLKTWLRTNLIVV
uniref:Membrane bound O-acyl transferase family-domain-containing protein n=1 Tax=Macrostomum lignano TaxID=282301 RepID=A0A1I8IKW8_9PLAT